jgi:hypothetical protein
MIGRRPLTKKLGWFESPAFNWVGVTLSLIILALYVQQLTGPDQRPGTPFVTAAWAVIFVVWLVSAIYKTWFRKA